MKKSNQVIVSGATGFVGQHLVPFLLNNNFDVIATARDSEKASRFDWYKHVKFIALDYHKNQTKIEITPGAGLIHLAWQDLPNYNSSFHLDFNLPKNYDFIKSLILRGVSQVLVSGTCFEYGYQSGPIPSTTPPIPINSYAIAKNKLREQLDILSSEHPFCFQWARLFYMFGKGQNKNSLLSQLEKAIDNGDDIFNMSGGEQLRDYLPVEKAVKQIFDLYNSSRSGIFNVCSGYPISVKKLIEDWLQRRKKKIKLNPGYFPYSKDEPMKFWGVRDIGEINFLPSLPNAPLQSKNQDQALAPICLRLNSKLNFLENEAFDENLIDYSKGYANSQANSDDFRKHMQNVMSILKANFSKNSFIVEIGCGNGDFVDMLEADGYFKVKGFDVSYEGNNKSIEKRYLNSYDRIDADLVVLRHTLEHIQRPYEFLSMLKTVFRKAYIYLEVPNYDWIEENKTFFDITYEHVNYFSKKSFKYLFKKNQLKFGLLFNEQYQYIIAELSSLNKKFDQYYKSDNWNYISFETLFPNIQNKINYFDELAGDSSVFIWGAATKGCLFLAHCNNRNKLIKNVSFAIDQNFKKIGKYLPGSLIEIKSKYDFFNSAKPGDLLIISNPAYKNEIVSQINAAGLKNLKILTL
jgi:nucleoside-diphosphate-sugar epimerase